jgi:hypothetical protein
MGNEAFHRRSRKVKAVTQVRITDERREALRLAILSGWAEQMFLIISDVAAIEPDSLPQWLRPGVEAARTMVERFKDVESVIETDPEMWKGLLCGECDRRKMVTEPLEQLIDAQREAESSPARANVEGIQQSSPKPSRRALPNHAFPRPAQGTRRIAQSMHAPLWLRNWLRTHLSPRSSANYLNPNRRASQPPHMP